NEITPRQDALIFYHYKNIMSSVFSLYFAKTRAFLPKNAYYSLLYYSARDKSKKLPTTMVRSFR
ncbi:MAG: hypothetical protein IJY70_04120, partial [Clostridia bacterium]|nr:hypothetical protein [Clostridia bacterium]